MIDEGIEPQPQPVNGIKIDGLVIPDPGASVILGLAKELGVNPIVVVATAIDLFIAAEQIRGRVVRLGKAKIVVPQANLRFRANGNGH